MTFTGVFALSLVFVLVNGLFVAAEFALLALPKLAIERRDKAGDRFARAMLKVLSTPSLQDRYMATAQLAITLASLGLGMYGEHALATLLEPSVGHWPVIGSAALATAIALGALTLLHIVIGEMVPKGIALQHPEMVARATTWPMRVTLVLMYPLVTASSRLARLFLRLLGIRRETNEAEQLYTPEELQLIVEESAEGGALRADSGRILGELFEFGDRTASEVMVPRVRVVGIRVGATPPEIRRAVATQRHTRYVVYDRDFDHIVGMVHVKDLLRHLIAMQPIAAADARRLPVVPETATLDDVLAAMQRAHAHLAVVIDEHGGTAGIVSLEDLFEEVVGEIDEGAPAAPGLVANPDGSVTAAGTLRLDELGRHFHLDLEHEEVDSVSGLVLARLGRPPVVSDEVEYGRLRLLVTAVSGRGVKQVKATIV
jgi:magnesium and cobalt exporter, CNNM family